LGPNQGSEREACCVGVAVRVKCGRGVSDSRWMSHRRREEKEEKEFEAGEPREREESRSAQVWSGPDLVSGSWSETAASCPHSLFVERR
jgi:hypothetical protein